MRTHWARLRSYCARTRTRAHMEICFNRAVVDVRERLKQAWKGTGVSMKMLHESHESYNHPQTTQSMSSSDPISHGLV